MKTQYTVTIGFMGQAASLSLYGDSRMMEGDAQFKLTTDLQGFDYSVTRTFLTYPNAAGGNYVDPFPRIEGKILTLNWTLITSGKFAEWEAMEKISNLTRQDSLLWVEFESRYPNEFLVRSRLQDVYFIDPPTYTKVGPGTYNYSAVLQSKNPSFDPARITPDSSGPAPYNKEVMRAIGYGLRLDGEIANGISYGDPTMISAPYNDGGAFQDMEYDYSYELKNGESFVSLKAKDVAGYERGWKWKFNYLPYEGQDYGYSITGSKPQHALPFIPNFPNVTTAGYLMINAEGQPSRVKWLVTQLYEPSRMTFDLSGYAFDPIQIQVAVYALENDGNAIESLNVPVRLVGRSNMDPNIPDGSVKITQDSTGKETLSFTNYSIEGGEEFIHQYDKFTRKTYYIAIYDADGYNLPSYVLTDTSTVENGASYFEYQVYSFYETL